MRRFQIIKITRYTGLSAPVSHVYELTITDLDQFLARLPNTKKTPLKSQLLDSGRVSYRNEDGEVRLYLSEINSFH